MQSDNVQLALFDLWANAVEAVQAAIKHSSQTINETTTPQSYIQTSLCKFKPRLRSQRTIFSRSLIHQG